MGHTNQAPHRTAQVSSSAAPQNARAFTRNEKVPTAIVIGGGPSGLISARRLAAAGMRVTLLEQRHHLGGAVGAHEVGGLLLDSGAESFATRSPIVSDLVKELGLGDQIVTPNSYGSWLYLPQGARRTPSTGIMGIPGNVNDKSLIPVIGKNGLRRAQVDKFLPVSAGENAKTLGELVRIRMGQKVLDNLVAPVVSGVYSTHPDKLDVDATIPGLREAFRKHRSLSAAAHAFRSAAPAGSQVAGIVGGMNQLSERLVEDLYAAGVRIVTGFDVIAVDRDESTGQWFIIQRHTTDGENTPLYADYLVLATDGRPWHDSSARTSPPPYPPWSPALKSPSSRSSLMPPPWTSTPAAPACSSPKKPPPYAPRHSPTPPPNGSGSPRQQAPDAMSCASPTAAAAKTPASQKWHSPTNSSSPSPCATPPA